MDFLNFSEFAGDIYDKQVPSAEAVQVFDWFLTELADRGKQVYAVSGNHDSAASTLSKPPTDISSESQRPAPVTY